MKKHLLMFIGILSVTFLAGCNQEEKDLRITSQPTASQTINFPDGFTLSVGVNNEKLVKSYQWQIDNGTTEKPSWVDLDCSSGVTNTLVKPSSEADATDKRYRCVLTDQNDTELITNDAYVKVNNSFTYKDVIHIANYAVLPGETFDLSTTNLGEGTIEYNSNGYEVTLHDVNFENSNPVYSYYDSPAAFNVLTYNNPHTEFIINVDGVNNWTNTLWQDSMNLGGVIFCFNFMENSQTEKVVFQGDGSLSLCGGTHLIYANTKVVVDCDMIFNKIDSRYGTGIYAKDIEIKENVNIDANLNGFLLQTKRDDDLTGGSIVINNGVNINCVSTVPHVSVGSTDFHLISAMTDLTMSGCNLSFIVNVDKNRFASNQGVGQIIGIQTHYGDMNITNCVISGRFTSNNPENSAKFLNQKLLLAENGNINISGCTIDSNIDQEKITNACGIYAANNITITDSSAILNVSANGIIEGISSNGTVSLNNSTVYVNYKSYSSYYSPKGVICCGLSLTNNSLLSITGTEGVAISVQVGAGEEKKDFDDNYEATVLSNFTISYPLLGVVNQYSIKGSIHEYVYMETLYAYGEKTNPSSTCIVSSKS